VVIISPDRCQNFVLERDILLGLNLVTQYLTTIWPNPVS